MFRNNKVTHNNFQTNNRIFDSNYKSQFNNRKINDNSLMKHHYNQIQHQYNILKTSNQVLPVIEKPHLELRDSNENELIFSNDNSRYLNSYKKYIESKSSLIDSKAEQYLSYMSKELRKSPNNKQYHPIRSDSLTSITDSPTKDTFYQRYQKERELSQQKGTNNRSESDHLKENSFHLFTPGVIKSYHSDINNPDYYRDSSENTLFGLLKEKQREILQYNKDMMDNKSRQKRNEIDTNPYRSYSTTLGKSYLENNTILNPVPHLTYNKYLAHF